MIKTDVTTLGRCNGMGELDRKGSYVKLVYHDKGENKYLVMSEGGAANLIGAIGGALAQRDDTVLADIMRNTRDVRSK